MLSAISNRPKNQANRKARSRNMLRGLSPVSFFADDHAAAVRWYTDVLGLEPYFNVPGYSEFRIGDYQHELGIIDRKYLPAGTPTEPAGAIVFWHVDDLPATFDRLLAAGAKEHDAPTERGEGFVTASVVDPFGNILGVMYNRHYLEMLASPR